MTHFYRDRYTKGGVSLNPSSPAFRFGTGFFETLYYNGKIICHLDRHTARIHASLDYFCIPYEPVVFQEVIPLLLEKNGLTGRPAHVNIFYPVAGELTSPAITAVPYEPKPDRTFRLVQCPEVHVSSLNRHKTMAYMFFNMAHAQAIAQGADDSLLTDRDGIVLETTTASLLFRVDGKFIEPRTQYKLPSIALDIARENLELERKEVRAEELGLMDSAYMLNSLSGMRPVVMIRDMEFDADEATCRKLSRIILG